MTNFELYLPTIPKRRRTAVKWTQEMIQILTLKFPISYNKTLANELGMSWRTLVRKDRELGIEKEPNFIENRKSEISVMAKNARKPNKTKGMKGWSVPGGEKYQFKPGHESKMKTDPELVKRVHCTRNETIRRDRIRRSIGLSPLTKFKHLKHAKAK